MKSASLLEEFVDLPELLNRVENDEDLLVELFLLFQEDLPESRAALEAAVGSGDLQMIAQAAHKLKGMLANLSAKHCAELAAEIESAARAVNAPKIPSLMAEFERQIAAFSLALGSFATSANE
jgi:two-component system sensor histidine kinase/response regulator